MSAGLWLVFFFFTVVADAKYPPGGSYHLLSLRQNMKISKSKAELPFHFQTHYFPQNLDHFSFQPESYRIFHQKYLISSHFWRKGGPIFVYTGNEGDIEWFASNTGFMLDIAPKFEALLVFIEHRFYGESKPPRSAKAMGYLNSQQALADYAILIRSLKQNLSSEASPVVVLGGSYGGMLAAWFRLKYPHIAIGALASSAPILQFDKIVPSSSFYDSISQDFKSSREAGVFSTMKDGLQELSKKFRSCKGLHNVTAASQWLDSAFVNTAMVNYPTPANFMAPLPAYPVEEMCKIIDGFPPEASNLDRAFAAASLYYNYSGSEKCFDIENETDPHGVNGWYWQACTEMVMPISCSNQSMFQPFENDDKGDQEYCLREYGVKPRPHWITTEFGGQRIEMVLKRFGSNIIFSNGMQDPWSREGILKNISSSIIALVTKKGAHHADLRAATKEDPEWLKEQRRQEVAEMEKWISEYYSDLRQEEQGSY
ncbi:hypothetical protein CARUB_v10007247mg [Capsella rubella]|uniref:Serine carboxypeptidase S28 family protein n=1 Tax=Capsella rubella TaxID=81985 RepID=R0FAC5_9BRAS|nr:hypothetical protein CARUB_v10007247mg [Capsella rubella]